MLTKENDAFNPFIQNYKLDLIEMFTSTKFVDVKDISDGIVMKTQTTTNSFMVEKQQKTSVYEIPFIENVLFGDQIKPSGRDLHLYIMYNLKLNSDVINLKADKVCKEMKISGPTLLSGIRQLTDVGIICRKSQSEYWINPFYMFKGNRIDFYNSICPSCINIVAKNTKK